MKFCKLMIAGALWLAGATVTAQAQSPEESRAEISSLVRGAFDTASVSYTHLTLPTNREV